LIWQSKGFIVGYCKHRNEGIHITKMYLTELRRIVSSESE